MKERQQPTWFDLSVAAISPVLIMGLVGSLAFFLLDIGYGGQYAGRLQWTLFFFVVGAVLVARIAIVVNPAQAKLYGLALGGAVFVATLRFLDYDAGGVAVKLGWLINLGIILVIFWSANRLVWNCTYIDEQVQDPGSGLLSALANPGREPGGEALADRHPRAHARGSPGLSVIYFTLAAFPIFGLGQSLIPIDDWSRRRYAFTLMTVYVASGLGLLCTTTLLGLRRYLRQRHLKMPTRMTATWLAAGGALIVLLMALGAFLPRPHAEYPLFEFERIGSQQANASRTGQGDQAGKGEGDPGAKGEGDDAQSGSGQGREGGKSAGKSGKPEGGPGQGSKGSGSKSGRGEGKSGGEKGNSGNKRGNSNQDNSNNPDRPDAGTVVQNVANFLKWVVLILVGIPFLLLALWFILRRIDSLPGWLKRILDAIAAWWQSLFGQKTVEETTVEPAVVVRRPRPFRAFANPFADGSASGRTPDELVRYSFAALDAWATEQDLGRKEIETPLEFADRIGRDVADLRESVRPLAQHYANLAYGRRHVPDDARQHIERFWLVLESAEVPAEAPA